MLWCVGVLGVVGVCMEFAQSPAAIGYWPGSTLWALKMPCSCMTSQLLRCWGGEKGKRRLWDGTTAFRKTDTHGLLARPNKFITIKSKRARTRWRSRNYAPWSAQWLYRSERPRGLILYLRDYCATWTARRLLNVDQVLGNVGLNGIGPVFPPCVPTERLR